MTARVSWAAGSALFGLERKADPNTIVTAVECRLNGAVARHLALLDTGASWSVIGGDLARELSSGEGLRISMGTRQGLIQGRIERVGVTLLAQPDYGNDLEVDAGVLLAPEWSGPIVLGMRGLLEKIRLELDPDQSGEHCWWSFAQSER